jgi:myosin heavy subunit
MSAAAAATDNTSGATVTPVANPEAQDILRQVDAVKEQLTTKDTQLISKDEELERYKKLVEAQSAELKKHRDAYAAEMKPQLEAFITASERLNGPMTAEEKHGYTMAFSDPKYKNQMERVLAPVKKMEAMEAAEKSRLDEMSKLKTELDSRKQREQAVSERLTSNRASVARVLSTTEDDNTAVETNVNASAAHRKSRDDVPYNMTRVRAPSQVDQFFFSQFYGDSVDEFGVTASSLYGTRERPEFFPTPATHQLLVDASTKVPVEDEPRMCVQHGHLFEFIAEHERQRRPLNRHNIAFDASQNTIEEKRTPNDDFRSGVL